MTLPTRICAVLLCVVAAACVSRGIEVREYVLTPVSPAESLPPVGAKATSELGVGIGPVELPAYLRRREIVVREDTNRVRASVANTWGEDLESSVARVLADNLSRVLPSHRVSVLPWQSHGALDYRVTVQVQRFERGPGDAVHLDARWTVAGPRGRDLLTARASSIEQAVTTGDYASTVDAMSRAVGQLSHEIARTLRELHQRES